MCIRDRDRTLSQEPHLGTDPHEDATDTLGSTKGAETDASEEVRGADGEGDELVLDVEAEEPGEDRDGCGVGVRADDPMDGKEMACVEDDEGEEEAAKQVEMASVDRVSEHDDPKESEQDADEGETKQAAAVCHSSSVIDNAR